MTIRELTERNLKVVADTWDTLRKSDVDRLLRSIPINTLEELGVAGSIIVDHCPEYETEVSEIIEEIADEAERGEYNI